MKQGLLFILMFLAISALAQQESGVSMQVDIQSRHYWRGFVFGGSPCIEPQVTFFSGNFSFNIWAATTFDDSYTEIDLIPSYTTGNYTISLLEYYNPVPGAVNRFFDFSKELNRHSVEATLEYNGEGKLPFSWMLATFFLGDKHFKTRQALFSTYAQVGFPFTIAGRNAEISAGISPWESYYSAEFALVHAGFTIRDQINVAPGITIPLKFSLVSNPSASLVFAIFSIGLSKE